MFSAYVAGLLVYAQGATAMQAERAIPTSAAALTSATLGVLPMMDDLTVATFTLDFIRPMSKSTTGPQVAALTASLLGMAGRPRRFEKRAVVALLTEKSLGGAARRCHVGEHATPMASEDEP